VEAATSGSIQAVCGRVSARRQMLQHLIAVAGRSQSAESTPDMAPIDESVRAGVRTRLTHEPAVSGGTTRLTIELESSETHQPLDDIELYLGATSNLFGVSRDLDEALHAHPEEPAAEPGRRQDFDVRFPRSGSWKVWVQVKRRNRVLTFPFSIEVRPRG